MEIANPWVLVSFELPAPSSQEVFDGPKILLANALVLVKLSSAFDQPLLEITSPFLSHLAKSRKCDRVSCLALSEVHRFLGLRSAYRRLFLYSS